MSEQSTTQTNNHGQASSPGIEDVLPLFKFQRLLNQDRAGLRVSLLGTINSKPAILLAERAAFPSESTHLSQLAQLLRRIQKLGANDIYAWFLASSTNSVVNGNVASDLKLNLIYPCTDKHIAKYELQQVRVVTETPQIYQDHVRPFMKANRKAGRLNWIFNILEGREEQEDIMYREEGNGPDEQNEGFLLSPDLNWDRETITSLHLLGLVDRRDIWSVRDLTKAHIPWLQHMRQKMIDATTKIYPQIEVDQLKLYVHYQPTYYHFHIHVVHVMLEAGMTQAVGKAIGLESILSQLEVMADDRAGMQDVTMTYHLGEASELWKDVFAPLKQKGSSAA